MGWEGGGALASGVAEPAPAGRQRRLFGVGSLGEMISGQSQGGCSCTGMAVRGAQSRVGGVEWLAISGGRGASDVGAVRTRGAPCTGTAFLWSVTGGTDRSRSARALYVAPGGRIGVRGRYAGNVYRYVGGWRS